MIKKQHLVTQYKIDIEMPGYKQKNHRDETDTRIEYMGAATVVSLLASFLFYVILDVTPMLGKMENIHVLFLCLFIVIVFMSSGLFISHIIYNQWRDSPRRYRIKTDTEFNFMSKIKEEDIPLPAKYFDEILSGRKGKLYSPFNDNNKYHIDVNRYEPKTQELLLVVSITSPVPLPKADEE